MACGGIAFVETLSVQGRFHLLSSKNSPLPIKHEHGNGWFLKHVDGRIKRLVSKGGIISILRLFSELCMKPFYVRVFRILSAVIRSATPLQHTCWNPAMIFVLFKSFLDTVMLKPLWFTPMSSIAAVLVFKVP